MVCLEIAMSYAASHVFGRSQNSLPEIDIPCFFKHRVTTQSATLRPCGYIIISGSATPRYVAQVADLRGLECR